MQITSVNSQSFKSAVRNEERMQQLEQKRIANQWASEGCNGGLGDKDSYELGLRREYQTLQNKAIALQWGCEGCNASLSAADLARMSEIELELQALEPKTAPIPQAIGRDLIYDVPSGNIYGVPESTFWGDWAR